MSFMMHAGLSFIDSGIIVDVLMFRVAIVLMVWFRYCFSLFEHLLLRNLGVRLAAYSAPEAMVIVKTQR